MKAAGLGIAVLGLSLSGCVAYAPAPPRPEAFAPAFDARTVPTKPAGQAWSGAELIALAAANSPQVAQARAAYAAALAAAQAAKASPGPNLTLTAEYAADTPHWGYQAAADVPLDLGGRRETRITTANLQALQAYYDLGEALWTLRTDLAKARADLLSAEAEIDLAGRAVGIRTERAERVEARVAHGQDARTLALSAQADLTTARRRLAAAQGRRDAALGDLAKALGVSRGAVGGMTLAPLAEPAPALDGLAAWRRDAAVSRRDILKAVADYDIADQALRAEIANQYPSVSISPSYFYDHGAQKYPASAGLTLPPWDLNKHAIAKAAADRVAAGKALDLAQANALAETDAAASAFVVAWDDERRNREHDLPVAKALAGAASRSRAAGESDRVDELAALGAEIDAELARNDARHAAATATAELEDALRRPFDPRETAAIAGELEKTKAPPTRGPKGGAR